MEDSRQLTWSLEQDCLTIDNFLTLEECSSLINYFERSKKNGFVAHEVSPSRKDGTFIVPLNEMSLSDVHLNIITKRLFDVGMHQYMQCFPTLKEWLQNAAFSNHCFKIQKTPPGGGFHSWHHEQSHAATIDRFLTWTIYLNEVEGGETEFLYKNFRVAPKTGRLSLFPCHFTMSHRGNPPLDKDKYIVTGWFTVYSVPPIANN